MQESQATRLWTAPRTEVARPPNPQRFETLDAWRGICALLVATMHFPASGPIAESPFIRNAWMFVDFFFVLSGFVIAHGYARKIVDGVSYLRFAFLRLGRIYPLHLATLAAFVLYELARLALPGLTSGSAAAFTGERTLAALASNALLLNGTGLEASLTWNGPSWSISSEFWAYMAFGALVLALKRRYWMGLLPVLVLAPLILYGYAPKLMDSTYDFGLIRCLYGFSAGALLYRFWGPSIRHGADAKPASEDRASVFISTFAEVSTVIAVFVFVKQLGMSAAGLAAPFLFAFAVYVFARESGFVSMVLRTRPFALAGRLSFAIYLVHILVQGSMIHVASLAERFGAPVTVGAFKIGGLDHFGFGLSGALFGTLMFAIMLLIVICVAWAAHMTVEEPMRRWSRRLASRIRSKQPVAIGVLSQTRLHTSQRRP